MRDIAADLARQKNTLAVVQDVMAGCSVKAPTPGMVIYAKEWNGKKRTAGSQVSSWDPAVATLPDLTEMESVTYVNEIDRKSTRLNSSHSQISYAVFCLKKKKK